jgi:hypothetical protein
MQRIASKRKEKILKSYRTKFERFIKWIFFIGTVILSIIVVYNIANTQIPLSWKVAISTFILLLPFSLYLQAALHVSNMKIEKISKYQSELRKRFEEYYQSELRKRFEEYPNLNEEDQIEADEANKENLSDEREKYKKQIEENYKKLINKMEFFLLKKGDLELYNIYPKAYRNYREERTNLNDEIKKIESDKQYSLIGKILIYLKNRKLRLKNSKLKNLHKEERWLDEYRGRFLKFEIGSYLDEIVDIHMRESSIDFSSYIVPLSFFIFMYLTGFLIIVPLINSVFIQKPVTIVIPIPQLDTIVSPFVTDNQSNTSRGIPAAITDNQSNTSRGIPLAVVQWGFLGGIVYTSIDLLSRFSRKDLTPRVYFNSSFRLIYSAVVAIVIYFSFSYTNVDTTLSTSALLLIVFLAGVAPIQLLIYYADNNLVSRIYKDWRRGNNVGNKPVNQLEGINSSTAGRLGEEGIDYIQQLALCNPNEISFRTNYPLETVKDWKDQAILYILTGNVIFASKNNDNKIYLIEILQEKMGIRTISSFIQMWESWESTTENEKKNFFKSLGESLGILDNHNNYVQALFKNIYLQGKTLTQSIDNEKKDKDLPDKGTGC